MTALRVPNSPARASRPCSRQLRKSTHASPADAEEIARGDLEGHVAAAAAAIDRGEIGDRLVDQDGRAADGQRHDAAELHSERRSDIRGVGGAEVGAADAERVRGIFL